MLVFGQNRAYEGGGLADEKALPCGADDLSVEADANGSSSHQDNPKS